MSDLGGLLVRLCAAGPLLYIGLVLLTDPASIAAMSENLAVELQRFEQRLRGFDRVKPVYSAASVSIPKDLRIALQCTGAILIACGVLAVVSA